MGGGGGGVRVGGGQGGCELRSEAFVNIQKKNFLRGGGGGLGRGGGQYRFCTILGIIKIIKRGSVGAGGLDLTKNHLKMKKKTKKEENQSRTNGPINAHLTIPQV